MDQRDQIVVLHSSLNTSLPFVSIGFPACCEGIEGGFVSSVCGSRRRSPVPLVSCPDLLLVVLDGDDEEHEQGDALDPCQQEEVVVQMAVVDVTW